MSAPTRTCIACQQTDNHPKHMVIAPDGSDVVWHMDCHKLADPPCAVCMDATTDAPEGAKGETLREHLVTLAPIDNTAGE
jgi:hypothetical protein